MKKTIIALFLAFMSSHLMNAATATYNAVYVWSSSTYYTVYLLADQPSVVYDGDYVVIYSGGEEKKRLSLSSVSKVEVTYGARSSALKLNSKGYGTFSYPNDVKIYTSGVDAYTAKVNGSDIVLTKIANKLVPAGTGVILVGAASKTFYVTDQKATGTLGANDLYPTTLAGGGMANIPSDKIVYALNGNEFLQYVNAEFALDKAFFAFDSAVVSEAKLRLPVVEILDDGDEDDDDETAIQTVVAEKSVNDGAFYDLSGRRVTNPVHGIYIRNGKKVIVK